MKRKIKNHIWGSAKTLLGEKRYEVIGAQYNLGYKPDVRNPQTFSEKIMYKKLFRNMDYAIDLDDKYSA